MAGDQQMIDQEASQVFHDRVDDALGVARAATTNIATALASVTIAVVGAAVTLATAKPESTPVANAMPLAIAGAGMAAMILLIALAVEAVRANHFAEKWRKLYLQHYEKVAAGEPTPPIPWSDLKTGKFSVSVHWKVSIPIFVFLVGLIGAAFTMAFHVKII